MTHARPATITVEVGPVLPETPGTYRHDARPRRALRVTWAWRRAGAGAGLFALFALVWNGLLALMLLIPGAAADVVMFLCLLPFVVIGMWLVYAAVAHQVNRTTLLLGAASLSVAHAPLPWSGRRVIELHRLRRVFVREVRDGDGGTEHVLCADVDGSEIRLVGGITPEEAHYLAAGPLRTPRRNRRSHRERSRVIC